MSRLASLLAAVPEPLTDLAGILTAVGVIIGSIWTAGRVLLNAFDKRAREANEPLAKQLTDLSTDLNEHRSYVYYHLGPNGHAKPMHKRMCDVEAAVTRPDPESCAHEWRHRFGRIGALRRWVRCRRCGSYRPVTTTRRKP
ncbi:MAG TPA: hypothetical protein PKA64_20210 [Myxococcota bacterium]|nr:hypothetical protein [Myxococcota bacterium]